MGRILKGCAAVVVAGALLIGCGGGGGSTPISEQSCKQLAATLADIQKREAPDQDLSTQSRATKDADALNTRVDALGGCPGEPSLQ